MRTVYFSWWQWRVFFCSQVRKLSSLHSSGLLIIRVCVCVCVCACVLSRSVMSEYYSSLGQYFSNVGVCKNHWVRGLGREMNKTPGAWIPLQTNKMRTGRDETQAYVLVTSVHANWWPLSLSTTRQGVHTPFPPLFSGVSSCPLLQAIRDPMFAFKFKINKQFLSILLLNYSFEMERLTVF